MKAEAAATFFLLASSSSLLLLLLESCMNDGLYELNDDKTSVDLTLIGSFWTDSLLLDEDDEVLALCVVMMDDMTVGAKTGAA